MTASILTLDSRAPDPAVAYTGAEGDDDEGHLMDDLEQLAAIRERLRAIEKHMDDDRAANEKRHDRTDALVQKLTETVASMSTTVAGLSIRVLSSPSPPNPGPAIAAGTSIAGAVAALAAWATTKLVGG